jgi:hypothetical protein
LYALVMLRYLVTENETSSIDLSFALFD